MLFQFPFSGLRIIRDGVGVEGQGNGGLRRGAFPGTAGILPALLILGTAQ